MTGTSFQNLFGEKMNKTIVKTLMPLFLAIVMAAAFVPIMSDESDATTGEYTESNMTYSYNTDTLTATLKTYAGTSAASVTIPTSITVSGAGVFVVNAIGKDVFIGHTEITSITIPTTITSIGSQAFRNISATEITVPDSVTAISSAAFQFNTALKTITFGSGVTSLPDNVLRGCTALETITLGKNVTSIGNGALYECSSLKTINIAEGNTSFVTDENGVLYSADKTVLYKVPADYSGTFTVPDTVTQIFAGAFKGCSEIVRLELTGSQNYDISDLTSLTSVKLGNECDVYNCGLFQSTTLTSVEIEDGGDYVSVDGVVFTADKTTLVCNPSARTGTYAIPEGTAVIGANAMANSQYSSVTFPDSVIQIEYYAFESSAIESLDLSGSGMVIGEGAFCGCCAKSVKLGNHSYAIGIDAFFDCSEMKTVYNGSSLTITAGSEDYGFIAAYADEVIDAADKTVTVKCGDEVLWTQKVSYGSDVTVPEFENYRLSSTSLTNVTADTEITATCLYVFTYDDDTMTASVKRNSEVVATSYDIPSAVVHDGKTYTVTVIDAHGFYDATSLTSVTFPDTLTAINPQAFCGCTNLTSVVLPQSLTFLGNGAFSNTGITSVTVPDSVDSVSAFGGSSFIDVFVSSSNPNLCSVDGVVFSKDKTQLLLYPQGKTQTSYAIPEGTVTVDSDTFNGCTTLTSVTLPSTLTKIGIPAFYDCTNLATVYNASDMTIEAGKFSGTASFVAQYATQVIDIRDKTVTVKCGDDTIWTETFAYGSDVTIPEIEGYTLSKTSIASIAADETVTATKIVCTVTVKCGENVLKTYSADYGSDVAIDAIEGYTLSKTAITGIKADETVTATLNTYAVKVVSGDWILAVYTADYGEDVTIAPIEGYELAKTSITGIKADETVTATKIVCTVTVKNGENILKTITADYGTNVIIDEIEGYILSKNAITSIKADETVTATPDAELATYTVKVVSGDWILATYTADYGEDVTIDAIEGYTLSKTAITGIKADETVTATKIVCTVTVKCGETVLDEIDAEYGSNVILGDYPGYTLSKGYITAIKADETVTAEMNVYIVTVVCEGITISSARAGYGETVTLDEIEGFTLAKAVVENVTADTVVDAERIPVTVTVKCGDTVLREINAYYWDDVTIDPIEGYDLSKTTITAIKADETVTATKIVCTVTVKCGENVLKTYTADYGEDVTIDAIEGYTLSKTSVAAIKADETVTATLNTYTVTVAYNGWILAVYTADYGEDVTIDPIEGYNLSKASITAIAADETVEATKIVCKVTVKCGETVLDEIDAEYGTNVIIGAIEGYTLSKTSIPAIKADETVTAEKAAVETGDVTVSVVCGDKAIWTQTVKSGSDVTVPALEGYEFSGVTLVSVGSDTVLSAKQILCTVKIVCGEEVLATYSVPYGENLAVEEIEGYTVSQNVLENVTTDTVVTAVVAEASGEDGEETEEKTEDDGTDATQLIAVAVCVILGCLCLVGTYFLGDPRMFAGALILYAAAFAVWKFL